MRVLYIIGCNEGESKRYRVHNMIEGLNCCGVEADWNYEIHEYIYDNSYLKKYDIVILFRCGYSERINKFIVMLNQLNIPVVFDIDDLVFDPEIVNTISMYNLMNNDEKEAYITGIKMVNQVMVMCDYITASTKYLCDYISQKYNKPTFLIRNGINKVQIDIAQNNSHYSGEIKYIGYLSGTQTHQKDFAEVAEALRRILDKYPYVFIKIIGYLDVEEYFNRYEERVIRIPFMKWEDLLIENSNLYINLAPLDTKTPYNHAKSQLKFFEAALCGVPTVCSPTEPYLEVITDGVNGYLAGTTDEWVLAIENLLNNKELHDSMAKSAMDTTNMLFSPGAISKTAIDVYNNIIQHKKQGKFKQLDSKVDSTNKLGLKISFIIPQPFEGSGGHRNIFRTIKYLSRFGHDMTVYVNPDNHRFKNSYEVQEFITKNFFDLEANVVWWADNIESCDVLFATHWSTAYIVDKNRDKANLHCYFIQDFEPYFYSMGYEYVISHNTYKLGLYPITSGPWPLRILKRDFGITQGDYFRFPIDRKIYFSNKDKTTNEHPKIAFFARPDMPRRCYNLGIQGLEIVKKMRPDVEIILYGAKSEKYQNVPFEFTNLGMLPQIQQLGELYRSCDIGICFSTTNPSLVPYEMMACGCPVIDLDFNDNVVNYGSYDNAMLVGANANEIAQGINKLLDDSDLKGSIVQNGLEYVTIFPEEEEMVRLIEKFILEQYPNQGGLI